MKIKKKKNKMEKNEIYLCQSLVVIYFLKKRKIY